MQHFFSPDFLRATAELVVVLDQHRAGAAIALAIVLAMTWYRRR